jgi:dihydrofolate reductase
MNTASPELVLIAAVARNGGIGRDQQLLWRLPEDMAHFRRQTQGCPVIMGRKTWESLPERFRPLPGRRNIVLSRQAGYNAAGAEQAADLPTALALLKDAPRVFVIGGEQVYRDALPLAHRLLLTEVDLAPDADAFFPPWPAGDFVQTARENHRAASPNDFDYAFVTYQRLAAKD